MRNEICNNNNNEKNPTKFQAQEDIFAVFNKTPQIIYAKISKQLLNLTIIKYGQFWGLRNIRALLCWREEKQHTFWAVFDDELPAPIFLE